MSKLLGVAVAAVAVPWAAHVAVGAATRIEPPTIELPAETSGPLDSQGGVLRLGRSAVAERGGILEVHLVGTPEAIGHAHARLLHGRMAHNEGALLAELDRHVPLAAARHLLLDIARLRYRHVDQGMPEARRRELAAQAEGFSPDPFDSLLPTYQRFVFLQALYDISLSFEGSPLLGCTSFALAGGAAAGGRTLLARNFDFEAHDVLDTGKAVFLVREEGAIPYASVAWPGLVGVVTGMNARGLGVVLHGGRARTPRATGEPVVHTLRDVLARAATLDEAIELLLAREAMVSHLVLVADAAGGMAVVERAPGAAAHARRGTERLAVTNHFEGPLADDEANRHVLATTTTRTRRERLDEALAALGPGATARDAAAVLRDKRGAGGALLPLGDRRAIDALIATHGVVMDLAARVMWVSEGPHLVGKFLAFPVGALLDGASPGAPAEEPALDEDPAVPASVYHRWVNEGSPHPWTGGP